MNGAHFCVLWAVCNSRQSAVPEQKVGRIMTLRITGFVDLFDRYKVETTHSSLRNGNIIKYRTCILMAKKERRGSLFHSTYFPLTGLLIPLGRIERSGKSGGGAEAGGGSVNPSRHKKLTAALEGGHSASKEGRSSLTRTCSWGACCCFVPRERELPAILWRLNRPVSDKLYLDLMGNQAGIPSSPSICLQRAGDWLRKWSLQFQRYS